METSANNYASACPACGADRGHRVALGRKHGLCLHRCRACGLVYVDPRPDNQSVQRMYDANYFQGGGFTCYGYRDYAALGQLKALTFRRWIQDLGALCRPGTLLDVGCATGLMLDVARDAGWRASGLDVSEYAVAQARQRGHTVYCGMAGETELPVRDFDAILMLDLPEHTPEPARQFAWAVTYLRPGGLLYIVTPDAGSLSARLQGKAWPHMKPREHLCLFTRRAMTLAAGSAGLRVVSIRSATKAMTIAHLATELCETNPGVGRLLGLVVRWAPALAQRPFFLTLGEMCAVLAKPGNGER